MLCLPLVNYVRYTDVDEQLIMAETVRARSVVHSQKRLSDEKLHDLTNIIAGKCAKHSNIFFTTGEWSPLPDVEE